MSEQNGGGKYTAAQDYLVTHHVGRFHSIRFMVQAVCNTQQVQKTCTSGTKARHLPALFGPEEGPQNVSSVAAKGPWGRQSKTHTQGIRLNHS